MVFPGTFFLFESSWAFFNLSLKLQAEKVIIATTPAKNVAPASQLKATIIRGIITWGGKGGSTSNLLSASWWANWLNRNDEIIRNMVSVKRYQDEINQSDFTTLSKGNMSFRSVTDNASAPPARVNSALSYSS